MTPVCPPKLVQKLFRIQPICSMSVSHTQTGNDDSETFVVLRGLNGETVSAKWDTVEKYLTVRVDYNSVAAVRAEYANLVKNWARYEHDNAEEIALLRKLRAKHGDV